MFRFSLYRILPNRSSCAYFLSELRLEFISKGPTSKTLSENLCIKEVQEIVNGFSWTVVLPKRGVGVAVDWGKSKSILRKMSRLASSMPLSGDR